MDSNIEKEKSLKEELKEAFVNWASSSTSHGFPNIFRTKILILKLIWLVFLLIATGACIYMCTEAVLDYLDWEVVTKVRVYSEIPIEFPVITVCNLNPWTGNLSVDLMRKIYEEKNNLTFNESLTQIKNLDQYRLYFEREAANPSFGDENRKKLGPSLDDMLLHCLFNNNNCDSSEFEWLYRIDYGNCYRFNTGKNQSGQDVPKKFIHREGDWSALELDLFLPENYQMAEINYKRGVRVYIENSTYLHSMFANGIDAKPGTFTEIIMKKQITERLSKPYSNCQSSFPSEFASLPFLAGVSYREKDCTYICIQRETIERCNCYDSWYERIDEKTSPCLTEEQIECTDSYFLDLYKNGKSKKCAELCLPECYSVSYEATYSASNTPSRRYYEYTLKYDEFLNQSFRQEGIDNFTYELLRERFLSLKVYFNDLSYLKISELKKTTASDLVANIGGTVGLFIGVSLLSVIELVEIAVIFVHIWLKHRKTSHNFSDIAKKS